MAAYSVEERGSAYSTDYRMYISELHVHVIRVACLAVGVLIWSCIAESGDQYISPFHDVPLAVDDGMTVLNMVVEIPRWTNAKMEV